MIISMAPGAKTLVDVTEAIAASTLPETRKAELTNAVNTIGRWLGRSLGQLPANRTVLTPLLKNLVRSPARTGAGRQHVKNTKCTFEAALDVLVPRDKLPRVEEDGRGLDGDWKPLWVAWRQRMPRAYPALSLLMRYCTAKGIAPEAVDEAVVEATADWMMANGKRADRKLAVHQIRGYWNQAVREVPGWPQRRITTGLKPVAVARLPEEAFSPAFIASLDELCRLAATGHGQVHEEGVSFLSAWTAESEAPAAEPAGGERRKKGPKILKPSSVAAMRKMVLQAASSLVLQKQAESAAAFSRVEDVVHWRALACLIDSYVARNPPCPATGQFTLPQRKTLHTMIGQLLMAAVRLPPECKSQVEMLCRRADAVRADRRFALPKVPDMTRKNKERLEQFTPGTVRALIEMPVTVFRTLEEQRKANLAAERDAVSKRMAKRAETAIAVMILNGIPVRKGQLLQTDMVRNMHWPADRKAEGRITWEAWQTKTGVAQSMPMAPWKMRLLELYRDIYRPRLSADASNTFLFPGAECEDARRRSAAAVEADDGSGLEGLSSFGDLIKRHVEREIGVTINPHLWRHLAKRIMLDYDPGQESTVATLLAHSLGRKEYGSATSEQAAAALEQAVLHSVLKGKRAAQAIAAAGRRRR